MSGGGKGGRQTTEVVIPEYLEGPIKENIARAQEISNIGFVPYYGPDVAALTPMQNASMGNTNMAAQSMGLLGGMGGMPPAQDFGGVQGYSSAPMFNQSLAMLEAQRPGQFGAIQNQFLDPFAPFAPAPSPVAAPMAATPSAMGGTSDASQFDYSPPIGGPGMNTAGGGKPGFGGLY